MAKRSQITLEEIPGDEFPDMGAARQSARFILAADLAETIRRMIDQGRLEVRENQIIPKGQ
jgi:hypothetical protein